jgi:hypothetical protein
MLLDADQADEIESSISAEAPQYWANSPDAPLADVITRNRLAT